jgi:hypothetical protein
MLGPSHIRIVLDVARSLQRAAPSAKNGPQL